MKKKTFWTIAGIALVVLVLVVIWQTMQINALSSGASTVTSTARVAATTAARTSSGMVGGC